MTRQVETHFLVNFRNATASASFRRKVRPPGYLVAPAYLTRNLAAAAVKFSRRGNSIVADNGLFDDITRLANQLGGRPPSRALAAEASVAAAAVDAAAHYDEQVGLEPSAIIGVEDITPALWMRLGLSDRELPDRRDSLRRRNRRTATRGAETIARLPGSWDYLPVASAYDYDSAFDAGREFAAAGLTGAAMGFGAFMRENAATRTVKIRGRQRRLAASMPVRYLGTALVARGFWDGWRAESGGAPERFHFLGLGAPIMMGVVSLAGAQTPVLTFDATSPIKDAAEGTIYVSKPAHLKIRTWKAAERLAMDPRERWRCPCGFCRAFTASRPFEYERGNRWYATHGGPVRPTALRGQATLARAYPLLAQPSGGDLGREIDFARVGHNHWALEDVAAQIQEARLQQTLTLHVGGVVIAYDAATPLRNYAAAVRLSFDIARGAWP